MTDPVIPTPKLKGADGLRGFACLLVLCTHSSMSVFPATAAYLSGCGKIGVWLFFVLSAFLLTFQLSKRGLSKATVIDYALGRSLRILPAFCVIVIAYHFLGTAGIDTWQDVGSAILMTNGYAHLWTIPVEFKTYAAIPVFVFALLWMRSKSGLVGALALTAAAVVLHQAFFPYALMTENSISWAWYLSAFAMGCGASVALPFWQANVSKTANLAIAVTVLLAIVCSTPAFRFIAFGTPPSNVLMNKYVFFSAGWALFVLAIITGTPLLTAFFESRALKKLGGWSYSIYLVHWFFLITIAQAAPNNLLAVSAVVAASIVAGAAYNFAIEAPSERLRVKLRDFIPQRALISI